MSEVRWDDALEETRSQFNGAMTIDGSALRSVVAAERDESVGDALRTLLQTAKFERVVFADPLERRKALAFESAPDGMAIMQGLTYVEVNAAHARLHGYCSSEAMLGLEWQRMYAPSSRRRLETELFSTVLTEGQWSGRLRALRADGSSCWLDVSMSKLDSNTALCCSREASAHMQLEKVLRDNIRELEATNKRLRTTGRSKDKFLAAVCHELRNSLNAVVGSVELLEQAMPASGDGPQSAALSQVNCSTDHLLELLGDVLDLSKFECGFDIAMGRVPIREVCAQSMVLVAPIVKSRNLTLELHVDPSLTSVHADRKRLKQILANLLSNAAKFTPRNGRIGVRVIPGKSGKSVQFEVWDTGPGLAGDQVERLRAFAPFTQLSNEGESAHAGAGLGLSIVRKLVDMHGGSLSIRSELGKGSQFTVELAIASANSPALTEAGSKRASAGEEYVETTRSLRVLLVDDNAANMQVASSYLARTGAKVLTAATAKDAFRVLRGERVDVMVCDVRLPDMDGMSLARFVRKEPRFADLPIVGVTALADPAARERCLAAGMNDFLEKPVRLATLNQTLHKICRERPGDVPVVAPPSVCQPSQ